VYDFFAATYLLVDQAVFLKSHFVLNKTIGTLGVTNSLPIFKQILGGKLLLSSIRTILINYEKSTKEPNQNKTKQNKTKTNYKTLQGTSYNFLQTLL